MKTKQISLLLAVTALVLPRVLLAQGTGVVLFSNLAAPDPKRVWANENGTLVRAYTSVAFPGGYHVALYWGPQGTPESQLVLVGGPVAFVVPGMFSAGHRTLSPLSENGAVVTVQTRGWVVVPGIEDSYEAVLAAALAGDPRARVGKGPVFDQDTKDLNDLTEPAPKVGLNPNWNGFIIGEPMITSTYSLNAVGYYTVDTAPGYYMIANQFNKGQNLLADVLPLPDWAEGTEVRRYDAQNKRFFDSATYVAGLGWYSASDPAPALKPGDGAFIYFISNGVPAAGRFTFVGDIAPKPCPPIYAGYNFRSLSLAADLAELNPTEGDTLFIFDMWNQFYRDPWTYIDGLGWFSASDPDTRGPRIPAGQSFFLWANAARAACVIEGAAAAASVLSPLADATLLNPTRSESTFSFEFLSEAGRVYQIQSSDTYPPVWNARGAPMGGTGQTIQFTDTSASGLARYYRLATQ